MEEFIFWRFEGYKPNILNSWHGHEKFLFMGFLMLDSFIINIISLAADPVFSCFQVLLKSDLLFQSKIPSCNSVYEPKSQLCLRPWAQDHLSLPKGYMRLRAHLLPKWKLHKWNKSPVYFLVYFLRWFSK